MLPFAPLEIRGALKPFGPSSTFVCRRAERAKPGEAGRAGTPEPAWARPFRPGRERSGPGRGTRRAGATQARCAANACGDRPPHATTARPAAVPRAPRGARFAFFVLRVLRGASCLRVPNVTRAPSRPRGPNVPRAPSRPHGPDVTRAPSRPRGPDVTRAPSRPRSPNVTRAPSRPRGPNVTRAPSRPRGPSAPRRPRLR